MLTKKLENYFHNPTVVKCTHTGERRAAGVASFEAKGA